MKFKRASVCFPVWTSLKSKQQQQKHQNFRNTEEAPIIQNRETHKKFAYGEEKSFGESISWDC